MSYTEKDLSLVIPSRNNLKYVKWGYKAIRDVSKDITICYADDASTDGMWDWVKKTQKTDSKVKALKNGGPLREGHTILYDRIVNELVDTPIAMIYHADMFCFDNTFKNCLKHMKPRVVVSSTRVEPPLHPPGPEKHIFDMGEELETFKEEQVKNHVVELENQHKDEVTNGIFAPWMFFKEDFVKIGGHDEGFYPQSKEDCITGDRILIIVENNNIKFERVGDLFDRFKSFTYVREDGKHIIDLKKNNIKIFSAVAKKDGLVGRNRISKIIRNKNVKDIYKVSLPWGETKCSSDHSLLDCDLNEVNPVDSETSNMWEPLRLGDWVRKTTKKELDLIENIQCEDITLINSSFTDIDEYGNNSQLIDVCEFLGFYVAEGSVCGNSFSFCSNDLDELTYFKNKSLSLINVKYGNYIVSKKEGCKDVFVYRKGNSVISKFFGDLCGIGSHNKRVPEFIFNIPKVYQEAFLYGYLKGDGYLGTTINRQKEESSFSIDKRLLFNKNIFRLLKWKSTTKSDMLASQISFLLRRCYDVKTNISFQSEKGVKGVYNVCSVGSFKQSSAKIENLGASDCNVYDLEIDDSHTFVDAMGLVGMHNSDVFNRFVLDGVKVIQSRDSFVAHLTCRGSRRNPNLTNVRQDSKEWLEHNLRSTRNFIRKWGHMVKHDSLMLPVIPHKYDIGFQVKMDVDIDQCLQVLGVIEPWCCNVSVDNESVRHNYIKVEQPNTKFNLSERVLFDSELNNEVVLNFTASDLIRTQQESFYFIQNLPDILTDSGDIGEMSYGIFNIIISNLNHYETKLINCENIGWRRSNHK